MVEKSTDYRPMRERYAEIIRQNVREYERNHPDEIPECGYRIETEYSTKFCRLPRGHKGEHK